MPIYEYHCGACGADFEKLVYGTAPAVTCEKCGSQKTNKRMSRFGMAGLLVNPRTVLRIAAPAAVVVLRHRALDASRFCSERSLFHFAYSPSRQTAKISIDAGRGKK